MEREDEWDRMDAGEAALRILYLDQSPSSCGWALWQTGDELPQSGAWQLCEPGKRAHAFVAIHREISAIHAAGAIDILAHETPLKLPTDKVSQLIGTYGLIAHLESIAHVKRMTLMSIDQQDWRSTWFNGMKITGRENLKRAAIERARQFGMDPATDDEAEAIGGLDHVMHLQKIVPPWRVANPMVATL